MNKKLIFMLLLLCFGLLPSVAQAQDMSGLGNGLASLPIIILSFLSLLYMVISHKLSLKSTYYTPHRRLKKLIIVLIITNNIISLFFLCITFPEWLCFEFFLFGGLIVPIQLVASVIFLKKEFKKEYSYPEPPNIP